MTRRLLATLIGVGMLAGCGKAVPVGSTTGRPSTADTLSIQNHCGKCRLLAGLELTDKQKRQLKAIVSKARQAGRAERGDHTKLQELITAKTVDRDALTAAIEAKLARHGAKIDRKVDMLSAVREVLTPEQRQKLADNLTNKGQSLADRYARIRAKMAKIADKLQMTDEQKAKFDAVIDAYADGAEARRQRHQAMKQAVAEFMTSGDADSLREALTAAKPEIPVAAIVDAIASLDQDQRQQLMAMHMRHHRQRMGMGEGTEPSAGVEPTTGQTDEGQAEPEQVSSGDGQEPEPTPSPANP